VSGSAQRSAFALSPVDGTPLFYEIAGPPAPRRAVALLDGIGCDGYVWKYLRPALAKDRLVVHPHYRGHGRSPRPRAPARIGIADLADDVVAVLDDAAIERVTVCGHSMGVQVALEVARRHRDRVNGLVLLCGAPENPLRTFKRTAALEAALPTVRRAVARAPRFATSVARALLPTRLAYEIAGRFEVNRDLLRMADFMPYLRGMSRVELPYFLSMLAAAGEHSARDLLPSLRMPVLVVAGAQDGFTPPELSREMAAAIPDAELYVVADGSHTAPLERPDEVGAAVLDFLARRVDAVPDEGSAEAG
jgi:pimeloyl-ACP methyl ester carboxylesterase